MYKTEKHFKGGKDKCKYERSLIKLLWHFLGIRLKQPRKVHRDILKTENLGQPSSGFYSPSRPCKEYSLRGNVGISAPHAIK